MKNEILHQLSLEDRIEKQQRLTGKNINSMNLDYQSSVIPKIPNSNFFLQGPIHLNKHQRFSETPAHTHSFIELNYVLQGEFHHTLNGEKITLKANQVLLMDQGVIQQIDYAGQEDLMINLLLQVNLLRSQLPNQLVSTNNWIANFFVNALEQKNDHQQFLIFDFNHNSIAQELFLLLIKKSLSRPANYQDSYHFLVNALLVEFMNTTPLYQPEIRPVSPELLQILSYMNDHYTAISLQDLAMTFGYNKNYLSNLLKSKTGITFQEMLDQKRLIEAQRLLKETSLSVNEIAEKLGYKSPPSLFKLFKNTLNMTPNEYRKFIQ